MTNYRSRYATSRAFRLTQTQAEVEAGETVLKRRTIQAGAFVGEWHEVLAVPGLIVASVREGRRIFDTFEASSVAGAEQWIAARLLARGGTATL